ncbi:chitin synthase 8 [Wallemia mellicola]|uniref:chitin synthase n=1 Tax=Wallemia mellicola TaxID=1708541 RepID=A0A4T0MHR4_9BASI|nr:chitin synthase 8 [Wallemia mellicola]
MSNNMDDISKLRDTSDDAVLSYLRDRFLGDQIYTRLGTSSIVALNPLKYIPLNSDKVLHDYALEYRQTDKHERLGPHIFQLAADAYYYMRRSSKDNNIILNGETGSGKSELRRLATRTIIDLSLPPPGKKGHKLGDQIPSAEFVLEAFGNAKTLHNPNASRFGKYTELQFSDRGRLYGAKTLEYYFERSRVVSPPPGERNYHIFYYLTAGASDEERQYLKLQDVGAYRYTSGAIRRRSGPLVGAKNGEDAARFSQLKNAFKSAGFSKRHVAQICQLVTAILHLGNLEFTIDHSRNADAAVVKNVEVLDIVSEFLGIHPDSLEGVLSYRTKLVKKDVCTVFLDVDGAAANRDDLARSLYSLLFSWIIEHINQHLCKDDFSTYISFLDLPGFQNVPSTGHRGNSVDQFCVNYLNERLQNWIFEHVFTRPYEEHKLEGISKISPPVSFSEYDNADVLRLLGAKQGGLIHIMDDQAKRAPKKNDNTMVEAFNKRWGNNSKFKTSSPDRSGYPTFSINHYAGTVTYSAENWIEKNTENLNPDFVSLFKGGVANDKTTNGSENPFIKSLFTSNAINTQFHPKSETTLVAAQQSVGPMRKPSTRRTGPSMRRRNNDTDLGDMPEDDVLDQQNPSNTNTCVATEFRNAADVLFDTLEDCYPWYVFCLSPNDAQLPNQLEARHLKAQIRASGIPAVARRAAVAEWAINMTHDEFVESYSDELNEMEIMQGDAVTKIINMREKMSWTERDLTIGSNKASILMPHLEDHIRSYDEQEQRQFNKYQKSEADYISAPDPFGPYATLGEESPSTPTSELMNDPFASRDHDVSTVALPLVTNSPRDMPDDESVDRKSFKSYGYNDNDGYRQSKYEGYDTPSQIGTEMYAPSQNMFSNMDLKERDRMLNEKDMFEVEQETQEEVKESAVRKRWVAFCWLLTWWVPSPFLKWFGRMKRQDVRQAWREKLAINIIIWFVCACAIFVIAILGPVICPTQRVYSQNEISSHTHQSQPDHTFVSIRGEVMDLTKLYGAHHGAVPIIDDKEFWNYGGKDVSNLLPVQVSALCNGIDGSVDPLVGLDASNTSSSEPNAHYHDFRAWTNDSRPDWYYEQMVIMRYNYRVGHVGLTDKEVSKMADDSSNVAIINGSVYDMTPYITFDGGFPGHGDNEVAPSGIDTHFMHDAIVQIFEQNSGEDVTKYIQDLDLDPTVLSRQMGCLRNLFFVGKVDKRNSPACKFSNYILLALSIFMIVIIGFKFLAAISFGRGRKPEEHDKFVIMQVPAYTEGEESLRRTIDSLACLRYDDKRKLIFVICDGNIIGSGNDRTTPRIVLDILGADPNYDPEPLSFHSIGEGNKQHNMGKIYSGLYECRGHVVPYIVLAKVGKPTERSRPGNRGKRDSQLALMWFLNKVHFDAPMNPLELEIYHQIKNVIGVNPNFYEYMLAVDADTMVEPDSLSMYISSFIRDKKILALCGETSLANAKQSIVTMAQVYEYYISHYLTKAFESLFGSITCLPGCFSIYRLRTTDTHRPLFIASEVIDEYSENVVNTLHLKNLLHLGEDRYLTTILLKHFPLFKTKFTADARAQTVAPDDIKVLLSQRRRWINSTVHNLAELLFLDRLCGFCCFSMRFIVFIDLLSTIIAPVTVVYIVYLIYLAAAEGKTIPTTSIIMLCAIYGLQALIFLMHRKWEQIGWMIVYICAIPLFSFFLPLYSFWHFDDFSWGSTHVITGEKGRKMLIHDEGHFDPKNIPLKTWAEYEAELWEQGDDIYEFQKGSRPPSPTNTVSIYGPQSMYGGLDQTGVPRSASAHQSMYRQSAMPSQYFSGYNAPSMYSLAPQQYPQSQQAWASGFYGGYDPRMSMNFSQGYMPQPTHSATHIPEDSRYSSSSGLIQSPSSQEIETEVRDIIGRADLDNITKKSIRQDLADKYGNEAINGRRAEINAIIDDILTSI